MTEARRPNVVAHETHPLFDLAPMAVFEFDLRGRVLRVNARARHEWREATPTTLRDLWERRAAMALDADTRVPFVDSAGMRALAGHMVHGSPLRVRDASGGTRFVATYGAPMRDTSNRVTGGIVLECDVSDAHRVSADVGDATRVGPDLIRAPGSPATTDRLLDAVARVTSVVVHDLNNVLNPILSAAWLLEHHAESPDMVRLYAQRIREATESGAAIANRLGRFVRRAPLREDEGELMQIGTVVDDALSSMALLLSSTEFAQVHVTTQHGEPSLVRVLPLELQHAVCAAVQNALEASPPGATVLVETDADDEHARITIRDEGGGMSDAVRSRAFEPFFSTKTVPGAGLGLAEVYSIARRHGGDVHLHAAEGTGVTITLRVPRAHTGAHTLNIADPTTAPEPTRQTILVVEDHDDGREFLKRVLQSRGHTVHAVATCDDARQRLADDGALVYNLLLTDVTLPDGSGWDLLTFVKAQHPSLRVGIITGWEPSVGGEVAAGAAFILQKPLRATELLQRVEGRRTTYPLE